MQLRFYLFSILLFSLSACQLNDEDFEGLRYFEPAEYPVVKAVGFEPIASSSSKWSFGDQGRIYKAKFNIADYPNAKEVYFEAEVGSTDRRYYAYGRLYNLTEDEPVAGSEIRNYWGKTRSDNLIGFLPHEEIELTMQVRSENEGTVAQLWASSFVMVVLE